MTDKKYKQMVDNYSKAVRRISEQALRSFRPKGQLHGRVTTGVFNPFNCDKTEQFTKIDQSKIDSWRAAK